MWLLLDNFCAFKQPLLGDHHLGMVLSLPERQYGRWPLLLLIGFPHRINLRIEIQRVFLLLILSTFLLGRVLWLVSDEVIACLKGIDVFLNRFYDHILHIFLQYLSLPLSYEVRFGVEIFDYLLIFFFDVRFNLVYFILYGFYWPKSITNLILLFDGFASLTFQPLTLEKEFLDLPPRLVTIQGHAQF